jgi:hypothetical protein
MQVYITPYADMGEYWIERGDNYFIVHQVRGGDPFAEFGYKVYASIQGYENDRTYQIDLGDEINEDEEIKINDEIQKIKTKVENIDKWAENKRIKKDKSLSEFMAKKAEYKNEHSSPH